MIYLLMFWNFRKLSRNFSLRRWLWQVLIVLRSFLVLIRISLYLSRLLITPLDKLKISLHLNFRILHLFFTILLLNILSHTSRILLRNIGFILSLCSPSFKFQKIVLSCHIFIVCLNAIMLPWSVFHVIFFCISLRVVSNFECYGMYEFIFLVCCYCWIYFLINILVPI